MLADVTFSTESLVVVTALLSTVTTGGLGLFWLLMAQMNKAVTQSENERDIWKSMAVEGARALEEFVNRDRVKKGLPKIPEIAAVVPEHQSPVTKEGRTTAEQATVRAQLTAAKLAGDLDARTEPNGENVRQERSRRGHAGP